MAFNNSRKEILFEFYYFDFVDNKPDFPQCPSYHLTDNYHLCFKTKSKNLLGNEAMLVKRQIKPKVTPEQIPKYNHTFYCFFFLKTNR